ncbi:MAG: hypothetical protein ACP5T3_03460, partial [Candidatus Micrarchaeia archaeon]
VAINFVEEGFVVFVCRRKLKFVAVHLLLTSMAIRYWEYEDAPLKEKLKAPSVKDVAKIYFENETKAYRFAKALLEVKKKGALRLKDCDKSLPIATWKRYLDFGVQVGLLKHEDGAYSFTDRYSKPFKNIAAYIKAWMDTQQAEDLELLFAEANMQKQEKRGGRQQREGARPSDQNLDQGATAQAGATASGISQLPDSGADSASAPPDPAQARKSETGKENQ